MEINYEKLRNLLIVKANEKIITICNNLGITKPTYYKIINCDKQKCEIQLSTLNKICNYYNENALDYVIL